MQLPGGIGALKVAYTQADLDALDKAMAAGRGVSVISFTDGQTVQFKSMDEMLQLRAFIARQIAQAAGTTSHYKLAVVKKGT